MTVIPSKNVYVAKVDYPDYGQSTCGILPEFAGDTPITTALLLLHGLFKDAGLDLAHYGSTKWDPLGDMIGYGRKVLLKPNWVVDRNNLKKGSFECVVTHTSVIAAVLEYLIKTHPLQIVVGDAPIQGCNFEALSHKCKLNDLKTRFEQMGYDISIRDFRMTKMLRGKYGEKTTLCRRPNDYCLFDLGDTSWLAPITTENTEFRVTQYNPDELKKNHCAGIHRYLVAREVLDADVVINLPKLKTHKKAGITGALKNMVGINGFKEYLPHHRKGGMIEGGDCYGEGGPLKGFAESCLDRANMSKTGSCRYYWFKLSGVANRLDAAFFGSGLDLEGSWHGNDTVWRTCLDLQRILHYGRKDATVANTLQRRVVTITDAIIAGDGDGPLGPSPVPLGVMTLGTNVAALEWVHGILMGFDPKKILLVANSFVEDKWPLTDFSPADIQVCVNGEVLANVEDAGRFGRNFSAPAGWRGHCEKKKGTY